jgi:phosphatidate cytidylyltransferase
LSNLAIRIISALVMGLIGLSAATLNLYSRWAWITVILSLAAWEYARMVSAKLDGPRAAWYPAVLVLLFALPQFPCFHVLQVSASACPGFAAAPAETWIWGVSVLATLSITLIGFRYVDIATMAPWIYLQLFGCAYFGLYAMSLFSLLRPELGWRGVFPLFAVQLAMATADTGAYATGRAFGKRKLCPTISKGKTVEGAVGGAVLTTIVIAALGPTLIGTGTVASAGLGLLLSGTAIIGDLFISILKRYTGTKDSSHLIPGHGGVLDRFDSLLFSAPVAAFYLHLLGH